MKNNEIHNTNILNVTPLPTPNDIKAMHPLTKIAGATVVKARKEFAEILLCNDSRLTAVVGPCSFHNTKETLQYAKRLAQLSHALKDQMLIVMRFCGDKPRTGKAWTGFINDPHMDGSCDVAYGWAETRKLGIEILNLGLPLGFEFLDGENFQRLDDLPSYVWIGARNVGSQRQRQIASGISAPVGFKNHNTAGVSVALCALEVATTNNVFVDTDDNGRASRFLTRGNHLVHLIHRGTETATNYDSVSISESVDKLKCHGFIPRIIVDVSHGNSQKDHRNQEMVIENIVGQVVSGSQHIAGIMYEGYHKDGNQPIPKDISKLQPDISVTDGCDGWETTERVLLEAHRRLSQRKR